MKNRRNIKGGENRKKIRFLFYTYIDTQKWKNKIVPYILCFSTN